MTIRVGIVGAGNMGATHARNLLLDQRVQLIGVADVITAIYRVGQNRRLAPAYRFLKERIAKGFQPYLANARQNDGDWLNPPWITNLDLTGGVLFGSSLHSPGKLH